MPRGPAEKNKKYRAKIKKWIKRKSKPDEYELYSVINQCKREGKIDDKFIEQLSNLALEDVIALKLEQASRLAYGRLYGVPIFFTLRYVAKEAALRYALSSTKSYREACSFLGLKVQQMNQWIEKLKIEELFLGKKEDDISRNS